MLKSTDQYLNLKIRIIIEEIDYFFFTCMYESYMNQMLTQCLLP